MKPSALSLLRALSSGPLTAAEVAASTGRDVRSVRVSLGAMASPHARRERTVEVSRGRECRYSLTYTGAEAIREADERTVSVAEVRAALEGPRS